MLCVLLLCEAFAAKINVLAISAFVSDGENFFCTFFAVYVVRFSFSKLKCVTQKRKRSLVIFLCRRERQRLLDDNENMVQKLSLMFFLTLLLRTRVQVSTIYAF